jgi:predicted RNase H-like HicB family nuclease
LASGLDALRLSGEELRATRRGDRRKAALAIWRESAVEQAWIAGRLGKRNIATLHLSCRMIIMRAFTAVVEKCSETGLFVGFVPGFPGAHTQGESLDELRGNLQEVISMLLEDGEPEMEAEYIGTQTVTV